VQLERPRGWTRDVQKRIELLVVVEHVHEGNLSFRFKPLRQLQVLLDAQVHVPVGQSTELSDTSGLVVDTEYRRTTN